MTHKTGLFLLFILSVAMLVACTFAKEAVAKIQEMIDTISPPQ